MESLRAILFDVDDTLFSTTTFATKARRNAVRAMLRAGLKMEEEAVYSELQEVIREFSSNYNQHFNKLLMRLPLAAQVGTNPALIVASGVAAYHDTKFRDLLPFEDAIPFLKAVRSAGLITGVVTHGLTAKQAEKIVRLGLLPYLNPNAIFISDQLGIAKPNAKLYQAALRAIGVAPEETMHVGDSLSHDIAPPKSLGMHTAWIYRTAREGQDLAIKPSHRVQDFKELAQVLRKEYNLDLPQFDANVTPGQE